MRPAGQVRCQAIYLLVGIDLRLMEGNDFRRTQLCKDASTAHTLAEKWFAALLDVGWIT